jgi:ankyrin repeat protein
MMKRGIRDYRRVTFCDQDKILLLLKYGANINQKSSFGRTPLHHAVQKQNINIIKVLLAHGADANITNYCKESPIWDAIKNNHFGIVKELIDYSDLTLKNYKGETIFDIAKPEIKQYLEAYRWLSHVKEPEE